MDSQQESIVPNIISYMTEKHAKCDELFAESEQKIADKNWQAADTAFVAFNGALDRHFRMEEQVLFPRLEQAMGSQSGPTVVMRMEHAQMREVLKSMSAALAEHSKDNFLGAAETLLILMQQHNMKEEQILYPMAQRLLANQQAQVISEMESLA